MRQRLKHCGLTCMFALLSAASATATVIDFEAQAAHQGGSLTGIPDSPLSIGIATFTGGELRDAEVGLSADQTGVYASEGLFGSGETNPLVISFAAPVNQFSVFVANADDTVSYTVSDNLGDSITRSLASIGAFGAATFLLAANGLTSVEIESADANSWNFAIDNVTFTQAPGPATPVLLFSGLFAAKGSNFREYSSTTNSTYPGAQSF